MRVLLDTDVLLDVGLRRQPWFEASKAVLVLAQAGELRSFVAWHSVANLHYLIRPRGAADARDFLRDLFRFARVASVGHADMEFALELDMSDLGDAMQAAAAVACRAARIVTRNTRHYRGSPVPAVTPKALLRELAEA